MLLKKFSNSDSESFSFIASCLLGFHLFIFIFYSFICSFIHLYVCMYLFILYLFILFVIATGHIYTPLWSTWRFEGFQSQLGDSDASFLFSQHRNTLNTRISKRGNCRSRFTSAETRAIVCQWYGHVLCGNNEQTVSKQISRPCVCLTVSGQKKCAIGASRAWVLL